jgi:hypothetical protein
LASDTDAVRACVNSASSLLDSILPDFVALKDTLQKLPVWTMRRIDELLPLKTTAQSPAAS